MKVPDWRESVRIAASDERPQAIERNSPHGPLDDEVITLERAIRDAGSGSAILRVVLGLMFLPGYFFVAVVAYVLLHALLPDVTWLVRNTTAGSVVFVLGCIPLSAAAIHSAAALYRRAEVRRLRARLANLPPEYQARVLKDLESEGGDTRKVIQPLQDALNLPGEVSPAVAPAARGDEAAPALEGRDA